MTNIVEVESPIPGVFFRRPASDKPPFIEIGDYVTSGQTLGLVEIMKQFAPLESRATGTLVDICVEDGANVEAGSVIFKIRTSDE
ncbi:acetyl-CoA carboxylase [Nocardia sp. NPDC047038]|uniref:acetyl-CoA carboxylase n=1 Tax=Nocardia sp. NPDC047038 TaxID=3154338 RepID=UPI00340A1822